MNGRSSNRGSRGLFEDAIYCHSPAETQ